MNSDRLTVRYGDYEIPVSVTERAREKPSVLIKVHSDLKVEAIVPSGTTDGEIRQALYARAGWIDRRLREFQLDRAHVTPRNYVGGESHLYLGRRYRLRITQVEKGCSSVKLFRGYFEVRTRFKAKHKIRQVLEDWYRKRAHEYFLQRLQWLAEAVHWINDPPVLRIRTMKKQWGNCSPAGTLTLNWHLIKTPRECIDYVILHELCHLVERRHGKQFYRLMRQVAPDWEKRKARLDSMNFAVLE